MRSPHWKQDTPKMQAVSVLSAIEGWLLNLESGMSTPERVLEHLLPLVEELKILHQVGMGNAWAPDSESTPEALKAFYAAIGPIVKQRTGKDLEEFR